MDNGPRPDGTDKRKFKRTEASFSVMYRVQSPSNVNSEIKIKEVEAIAHDLSEGGLALWTDYEIPVGAVMKLQFKIYNEEAITENYRSRNFGLLAESRYSFRAKDGTYRIGLRFMNLSEADQDFIAQYVKAVARKPPS